MIGWSLTWHVLADSVVGSFFDAFGTQSQRSQQTILGSRDYPVSTSDETVHKLLNITFAHTASELCEAVGNSEDRFLHETCSTLHLHHYFRIACSPTRRGINSLSRYQLLYPGFRA